MLSEIFFLMAFHFDIKLHFLIYKKYYLLPGTENKLFNYFLLARPS